MKDAAGEGVGFMLRLFERPVSLFSFSVRAKLANVTLVCVVVECDQH